jgi:hypothetical protein
MLRRPLGTRLARAAIRSRAAANNKAAARRWLAKRQSSFLTFEVDKDHLSHSKVRLLGFEPGALRY